MMYSYCTGNRSPVASPEVSIAGSEEVEELPSSANQRTRRNNRGASQGRGVSRAPAAIPTPTESRGRGVCSGGVCGRGNGGRRGGGSGGGVGESNRLVMPPPSAEEAVAVQTRRGTRRLQSTTNESEAPPSSRQRR